MEGAGTGASANIAAMMAVVLASVSTAVQVVMSSLVLLSGSMKDRRRCANHYEFGESLLKRVCIVPVKVGIREEQTAPSKACRVLTRCRSVS